MSGASSTRWSRRARLGDDRAAVVSAPTHDETFERWRDRVLCDAANDAEQFAGLIGRSRVPGALAATGPPGVIVIAANEAMEQLLRRSRPRGCARLGDVHRPRPICRATSR